MASIERRNLIRDMVQMRIGQSPRVRKRKWRRSDRGARVKLGQCTDCNRGPARPGMRRCAECAAYHVKWSSDWYQERKRLGLCGCRQRPVVEGRTLCAECAERNRLGAKARRAAKRAAAQVTP